MSEVDGYPNQCIGIVTCPTRFPIMHVQTHRDIPVYRLDADALDASSFRAKQGDVLLGGGSGESAALRVAIPEAFFYFTHPDWDNFNSIREVVEPFWTMTDAYIFGDGYYRLGWRLEQTIEEWLAEHILSYLLQIAPDDYLPLLGPTHSRKTVRSAVNRPLRNEASGVPAIRRTRNSLIAIRR